MTLFFTSIRESIAASLRVVRRTHECRRDKSPFFFVGYPILLPESIPPLPDPPRVHSPLLDPPRVHFPPTRSSQSPFPPYSILLAESILPPTRSSQSPFPTYSILPESIPPLPDPPRVHAFPNLSSQSAFLPYQGYL